MPLIQDHGFSMIWLALGTSSDRVVAAKQQQHAVNMFIKKFGRAPTHMLWIPYFFKEPINDHRATTARPQSTDSETDI